MKKNLKLRNLLSSVLLVLYALMAGSSLDEIASFLKMIYWAVVLGVILGISKIFNEDLNNKSPKTFLLFICTIIIVLVIAWFLFEYICTGTIGFLKSL